jgi:hypothetical protein
MMGWSLHKIREVGSPRMSENSTALVARQFRGEAVPRGGEPTQDIARDFLTGATNGVYLSVYIEVVACQKKTVC